MRQILPIRQYQFFIFSLAFNFFSFFFQPKETFGNSNYECEDCYTGCDFCFGNSSLDCVSLNLEISLKEIENPTLFEIQIEFNNQNQFYNRRMLEENDVLLSEAEDLIIADYLKYMDFEFSVSGIDDDDFTANVINEGNKGKLKLQMDYKNNLTSIQDLKMSAKKKETSDNPNDLTFSEMLASTLPVAVNYDGSDESLNYRLAEIKTCDSDKCYSVQGFLFLFLLLIKFK